MGIIWFQWFRGISIAEEINQKNQGIPVDVTEL